MKYGRLFVLSGPSGVGKSTILKELLARRKNIYFSVSATTRPPRPGEVDHVHYHFSTEEEFQQLIEDEELLEWAEYVGNYYGTPARYVRVLERWYSNGRMLCVFSLRLPLGTSWSAA